ncbi:MAG: hypothetical protein QOE82_1233 [Thermoanaerobaculia bacterium]|jgi:hypothetical protein|nr:hypothetical protein [Thermoanaerobaculia bacterium]
MKRRVLVTGLLIAAGLVWAATVGAMYHAVRNFETTPGRVAASRTSWPASSRIVRDRDRWTLVMLIHPHCSCTRASLQELERIIEMSGPSLQTNVLVYRPADFKAGWEKTETFEAAKRLQRARVIVDTDGAEARLFGGFTSGQTFLYDREGALRFSGGITSLRGHAGVNRGSMDVVDIVHAKARQGAHPVFGCAIVTTESEQRR